jgi:hypothetical protein
MRRKSTIKIIITMQLFKRKARIEIYILEKLLMNMSK